MPFKKGDYAIATDYKSILVCLEDQTISNKILVECVEDGDVVGARLVGAKMHKALKLMIPYQYNGKWNVNNVVTLSAQDNIVFQEDYDKALAEEADPFGLVKQRKDLREFIGG
jgi:Lhr-like helicase